MMSLTLWRCIDCDRTPKACRCNGAPVFLRLGEPADAIIFRDGVWYDA